MPLKVIYQITSESDGSVIREGSFIHNLYPNAIYSPALRKAVGGYGGDESSMTDNEALEFLAEKDIIALERMRVRQVKREQRASDGGGITSA